MHYSIIIIAQFELYIYLPIIKGLFLHFPSALESEWVVIHELGSILPV